MTDSSKRNNAIALLKAGRVLCSGERRTTLLVIDHHFIKDETTKLLAPPAPDAIVVTEGDDDGPFGAGQKITTPDEIERFRARGIDYIEVLKDGLQAFAEEFSEDPIRSYAFDLKRIEEIAGINWEFAQLIKNA